MGQRGSQHSVAESRPHEPGSPDAARELDRIARRSQSQAAAENFPVALRALPRSVRDQLMRAYRFARFVDDVGDEAAGDRTALLNLIDADVALLADGIPTLEPVRQLRPILEAARLPLTPFHDLVEANRQDQVRAEYETFDDLLGYCRLSAAPIGRIVLGLAGVDDDLMQRRSDRVCAALQVLEHCQDVGEDARAGRVYLPRVDLEAARVGRDDLLAAHTSTGVRRVVAQQVERAEALLGDGGPLVRPLRGWARLAVTGYVAGGRATALALARSHYDVLGQAITPGKAATLGQAVLLTAGR